MQGKKKEIDWFVLSSPILVSRFEMFVLSSPILVSRFDMFVLNV